MRRLGYTTETYIAKAKKIHQNKKYDYSLTVYTGAANKVKVICPTHGIFEITAREHIRKKPHGCYKCGGTSKSNKEKFIEKSIAVHGKKYIYDNVIYVNNNTYVEIICPIHGSFMQKPRLHTTGYGCAKCGYIKLSKKIKNRTTKPLHIKEIKKRIKYKFGDTFDLDEIFYDKKTRSITFECKTHGKMTKKLHNFLKSNGCAKCGNSAKLTTEEFKQICTNLFDGKYSYDKSIYTGNRNSVIITCPIHGDFEMQAANHMKKSDCPKCAGVHNHSTEEYIEKCNIIHGNKYTYGKTIYTIGDNKVIITCPEHGDFEQCASQHLNNGTGCPKCKESKGERNVRIFLDNNNLPYNQEYTFEDCTDKSYLRYDFYLPTKNILIEYHGQQHYMPVEIFGGKECFKETQRRDKIKVEYAKDNNINLLVIPYTDYDRIEDILYIYIKNIEDEKKG